MCGSVNLIPEFDSNGNLPPGEYTVTLEQIKEKLTWSPKRKALFLGLERAIENLSRAGVTRVYIDGSFTTDKADPNDIDGCWVPHTKINKAILDPVFLDRNPPREKMKQKYGVDFLIAGVDGGASSGQPIEKFFQMSRDAKYKGILVIKF